jgi:hypothetical protein
LSINYNNSEHICSNLFNGTRSSWCESCNQSLIVFDVIEIDLFLYHESFALRTIDLLASDFDIDELNFMKIEGIRLE